jgi:hypothetical protein
MPFLDEIVQVINTAWESNLPSYVPDTMESRFNGIAETVIEPTSEEKYKKYPAVIDINGDAIVDGTRYSMIDVDDDFGLSIYHRLESIANSQTKNGFGDTPGDMVETANMAALVIAFRNKSNIIAHQFEAFLKDTIPVGYKHHKNNKIVQTTDIKVGNSNFDKMQLLTREFVGVEVNYPELVFFEMKYTLRNVWKKGCFANS